MNSEVYKIFTETHHWGMLWVEMLLVGSAFLIMILEVLTGVQMKKLIPGFATMLIGIITMIFIGVMLHGMPAGSWFSGLIVRDPFINGLRLFLLIASFFASLLSMVFFKNRHIPKVEFYAILLITTACMSLLVQSNHMVMLFVSLEAVTIGFYVLIGYPTNKAFGLEAGIKYLILGGLSTGMLLLGIGLLYGSVGDPSYSLGTLDGFAFADIHAFLSEYSGSIWTKVGAVLLVAGLFFKMGMVPFHIWVPDVYQGAPTPVTALLAVSSKGVGFAILLLLFRPGGALAPFGEWFIPLLSVIAGLSILWGNLSAIGECNVKRMIGFSGIAHAGYLLLGMIAYIYEPNNGFIVAVIFFYLFSYLLASFAVFGVMVHWGGLEDADQQREHYVNLAKDNPLLALLLATGLSSLAGIPPMAGFIAKFLLFIVAFQASLWSLLGIAILGVIISIYYYFGWIREAFFKPSHGYYSPDDKNWMPVSSLFKAFWISIVVFLLLLGLYQGDWLEIFVNPEIVNQLYHKGMDSTVFLSN